MSELNNDSAGRVLAALGKQLSQSMSAPRVVVPVAGHRGFSEVEIDSITPSDVKTIRQFVSLQPDLLSQPFVNIPAPDAEVRYNDVVANAIGFDVVEAGNVLQAVCHKASRDAGWWFHSNTGLDLIRVIRHPLDALERLLAGALKAQKLALIHTEVSEAVEGDRKDLMDDKLPHRKMAEVECADAVIRICDYCGAMGYDLGGAIAEKLAFNAIRPDHKAEAREAAGGKAY